MKHMAARCNDHMHGRHIKLRTNRTRQLHIRGKTLLNQITHPFSTVLQEHTLMDTDTINAMNRQAVSSSPLDESLRSQCIVTSAWFYGADRSVRSKTMDLKSGSLYHWVNKVERLHYSWSTFASSFVVFAIAD